MGIPNQQDDSPLTSEWANELHPIFCSYTSCSLIFCWPEFSHSPISLQGAWEMQSNCIPRKKKKQIWWLSRQSLPQMWFFYTICLVHYARIVLGTVSSECSLYYLLNVQIAQTIKFYQSPCRGNRSNRRGYELEWINE